MDRAEGKEGEVKLHAVWKNLQAMMCIYRVGHKDLPLFEGAL